MTASHGYVIACCTWPPVPNKRTTAQIIAAGASTAYSSAPSASTLATASGRRSPERRNVQ